MELRFGESMRMRSEPNTENRFVGKKHASLIKVVIRIHVDCCASPNISITISRDSWS